MSGARIDGGPAFPAAVVHGGTDGIGCKDNVWHYPGMSQRTYIATQAMVAMMSDSWPDAADRAEIAKRAYLMADAILAEGAK